ncbi:MAG: hypothetical protein Q7T16_02420 [Candidatus Burarchaeum sp.]|nr:hypothetical protein [Candidatus Burarchaeum sp.]MDO8339489.1 hypothetical protein [Candidatus Burarchaeum sp.]
MSAWEIWFHPAWDACFSKLDKGMKVRVMKKIEQLAGGISARHLKQGLPICVCEIGQYRLCYHEDKDAAVRTLVFIGTHKDYEEWTGI